MRMLRIKKIFIAFICTFFVIVNMSVRAANILIIGGSAGIGKALVEEYSRSGYNVYTTFNHSTPQITPPNVRYLKVDLHDPQSIPKISESTKGIHFDMIICNAGKFGYKSNKAPTLDRQDWIDSFVVNSIAPIELAFALQDSFVEKGGKYVVITSRRGSNTVNIRDKYEGSYSYRSSKSALNSALVALSMDFKEKGVAVLMLHPGSVKTGMTQYKKGMEPEQSATMIKNTIELRTLNDTGKFIDVQNNSELAW